MHATVQIRQWDKREPNTSELAPSIPTANTQLVVLNNTSVLFTLLKPQPSFYIPKLQLQIAIQKTYRRTNYPRMQTNRDKK